MAKTTKTVTLKVTVRCPTWLTDVGACNEVIALIDGQCFYGTLHPDADNMDEIDASNFCAVRVAPVKKA